jgi:lysophospholipase L1-like esterase
MTRSLQLVVRVVGWAAIAALTLELCARVEDRLRYGAPLLGNYSMESLYRYDALGKYGAPHGSYLGWHLNGEGYRGPELRADTFRIACIGSSETFGLYESPNEEWPRQLEAILNEPGRTARYEAVDVAYPGMSVGTSLLRLPQMLAAVHPQMVVVYPSYSGYIDTDTPLQWPNPPAPARAARAAGLQIRIATRLHNLLKQALPAGLQDRLREYQVAHDPDARHAMARLPEKNVEAFQSDLTHLTAELKARGVEVILVTHANRFGKRVDGRDAGFLTGWRTSYPSLEEGGFLDMEKRMSAAVLAVAADQHVALVDAANRMEPGPTNFVEFVHFTDAGAHALAAMVAEAVVRETGEQAASGGLLQTNGSAARAPTARLHEDSPSGSPHTLTPGTLSQATARRRP